MPDPRPRPALSRALSRRHFVASGGAAAAVGLAAVLSREGSWAQEQSPARANTLGPAIPPEVTQYANDWPVAQADLAATRRAPNSLISSSNIAGLTTAWTLPITVTGNFSGVTANPIILGDTVYLQDMQSNVFAIDRNSGQARWQTTYNVPSNGPNGCAVGYGLLFAATGDTSEAMALDPATGDEVWRVKLSNNPYECIDMAPTVYDSTVYISTNPNNTENGNYHGGARGILYALDAKTGVTLWSFDTATDNLWGNPRANSGAGVWYPPSVDADGILYFGTGNAGPYPGTEGNPNAQSRPGDNDFAASMVSLDPRTGVVRWSINAAPHDLFDHDFQHSPILTTMSIAGVDTLAAIGAGKTGTVIAANAATGEELWRASVGKHQNDMLQALPNDTITEVFPGTLGGVESPIAFANDTVFVPYIDFPAYHTPTGADFSHGFDLTTAGGGLVALNAADGSVKWEIQQNVVVVSGATVVNDVVLSGGLDGILHAYDVETGSEVWQQQLTGGLNAPPAVAGDTIVIPAGGPIILNPNGTPPAVPPEETPQIFALRLGA